MQKCFKIKFYEFRAYFRIQRKRPIYSKKTPNMVRQIDMFLQNLSSSRL